MWIILTNRSYWVTTQKWWNFFYISIFYVQFSRKLYTFKDDDDVDVHQEGAVVFSAEKDSELIWGLSANVRGKSSNRYVGGMIFLLSSASLYTVISHLLRGLGESDHHVLVKTALRKLLVRKVEFCEHQIYAYWSPFSASNMFMDIKHFHSAWLWDVAISHSGGLSKCSSFFYCVAVLQDLANFFPPHVFNYFQL